MAKVRLIAQHRLSAGVYRSGIAIVMPSGSHTYWKQPGDAGVPPVFAFNGSTNVTKAEVMFPVPTRIKEDGLDSFGYTDQVVFPVAVTPTDTQKPSLLHLDMTYAVCNKICMPGHASADLTLPVGTDDDDAVLDAAWAVLPHLLPQPNDLKISPVGGASKPSWTLSWSGTTPITDIFADAPEGYAFDTKRSDAPQTWTLIASQVVPAPSGSVVVGLTLADRTGGFLSTRTLALPAPRHPSP